ncbi:(Fe-S)-binding protein [Larkinella terrae]|uniref:4Fe-4S dicluster domain-containing protein n=1 Tax=Larkinella terrae TaxID=2025311 RepID=A0A7K0EHX3_9BACT|nr:(Fe-S)-binding protein [Larkinella terrae]MRS61439.1 4Fe-4S dicluster domain-containing protein [Larkinella terrae]
MLILQQILFVAALAATAWVLTRRIGLIRRAIQLGRPENRTDRPNERLNIMLRVAFGQKKMMTNVTVGLMHFVIYVGFIIVNIEVLEIALDGIFGTHRLFAPFTGAVYPFLINTFEILALGVWIVCAVFLIRRFVTKVPRFQPERHREMTRWPRTDAALILTFEILLMTAFLTWNASDSVLRERGVGHYNELKGVGNFVISQFLMPLFANWSDTALVVCERFMWWFHILGILFFAVYLTYSKHLHIVLAFPNTYFSDLKPKGEIKNMPEITKEVQLALGIMQADPNETPVEPGRFGARDVRDLTWKNLMDAYSCTECGRCTAACPANITGKKLSPRKIMMDTRDRLEDIQQGWQQNGPDYDDGKTLLGDYITAEEINACTTCQACVQECPVNINPLEIILQLRRYKIMEEAQAPASWNAMFSNVENNMAPWKFSPGDRFNWADQVNK